MSTSLHPPSIVNIICHSKSSSCQSSSDEKQHNSNDSSNDNNNDIDNDNNDYEIRYEDTASDISSQQQSIPRDDDDDDDDCNSLSDRLLEEPIPLIRVATSEINGRESRKSRLRAQYHSNSYNNNSSNNIGTNVFSNSCGTNIGLYLEEKKSQDDNDNDNETDDEIAVLNKQVEIQQKQLPTINNKLEYVVGNIPPYHISVSKNNETHDEILVLNRQGVEIQQQKQVTGIPPYHIAVALTSSAESKNSDFIIGIQNNSNSNNQRHGSDNNMVVIDPISPLEHDEELDQPMDELMMMAAASNKNSTNNNNNNNEHIQLPSQESLSKHHSKSSSTYHEPHEHRPDQDHDQGTTPVLLRKRRQIDDEQLEQFHRTESLTSLIDVVSDNDDDDVSSSNPAMSPVWKPSTILESCSDGFEVSFERNVIRNNNSMIDISHNNSYTNNLEEVDHAFNLQNIPLFAQSFDELNAAPTDEKLQVVEIITTNKTDDDDEEEELPMDELEAELRTTTASVNQHHQSLSSKQVNNSPKIQKQQARTMEAAQQQQNSTVDDAPLDEVLLDKNTTPEGSKNIHLIDLTDYPSLEEEESSLSKRHNAVKATPSFKENNKLQENNNHQDTDDEEDDDRSKCESILGPMQNQSYFQPLLDDDLGWSSSDETPLVANGSATTRYRSEQIQQQENMREYWNKQKKLIRQKRQIRRKNKKLQQQRQQQQNHQKALFPDHILPPLVVDPDQLRSVGVKAMISLCNGIGSLFLTQEEAAAKNSRNNINYHRLPAEQLTAVSSSSSKKVPLQPRPTRQQKKQQKQLSPSRKNVVLKQQLQQQQQQQMTMTQKMHELEIADNAGVYFTEALQQSLEAETMEEAEKVVIKTTSPRPQKPSPVKAPSSNNSPTPQKIPSQTLPSPKVKSSLISTNKKTTQEQKPTTSPPGFMKKSPEHKPISSPNSSTKKPKEHKPTESPNGSIKKPTGSSTNSMKKPMEQKQTASPNLPMKNPLEAKVSSDLQQKIADKSNSLPSPKKVIKPKSVQKSFSLKSLREKQKATKSLDHAYEDQKRGESVASKQILQDLNEQYEFKRTQSLPAKNNSSQSRKGWWIEDELDARRSSKDEIPLTPTQQQEKQQQSGWSLAREIEQRRNRLKQPSSVTSTTSTMGVAERIAMLRQNLTSLTTSCKTSIKDSMIKHDNEENKNNHVVINTSTRSFEQDHPEDEGGFTPEKQLHDDSAKNALHTGTTAKTSGTAVSTPSTTIPQDDDDDDDDDYVIDEPPSLSRKQIVENVVVEASDRQSPMSEFLESRITDLNGPGEGFSNESHESEEEQFVESSLTEFSDTRIISSDGSGDEIFSNESSIIEKYLQSPMTEFVETRANESDGPGADDFANESNVISEQSPMTEFVETRINDTDGHGDAFASKAHAPEQPILLSPMTEFVETRVNDSDGSDDDFENESLDSEEMFLEPPTAKLSRSRITDPRAPNRRFSSSRKTHQPKELVVQEEKVFEMFSDTGSKASCDFSTDDLVSTLDDMVQNLDEMASARRQERTESSMDTSSPTDSFAVNEAVVLRAISLTKSTSKESDMDILPVFVSSLDNDYGIPIGDMMISLLKSEDLDKVPWTNLVDEATWRCRVIRRWSDYLWLREKSKRKPDKPSQGRTSICVDVDEVRVVGGIKAVPNTEKAALEHLKYDDFDDALALFEDISLSYELHAEEAFGGNEAKIGAMRSHIATAMHNLGIIHLLRGEHEESVSYFEQATELRAVCHGENHPEHVNSLVKTAMSRFALGDYALAYSELDFALRLTRENMESMNDVRQLAEILNNLGCLTYSGGEIDRSMTYFKESLKIQSMIEDFSMYDTNRFTHKTTSLNISVTKANLGFLSLVTRDFPQSVYSFESALKSQQLVLQDSDPSMISTMKHLVVANILNGKKARAVQLLKRLFVLQEAAFGSKDQRCQATKSKIELLESSTSEDGDNLDDIPTLEQESSTSFAEAMKLLREKNGNVNGAYFL